MHDENADGRIIEFRKRAFCSKAFSFVRFTKPIHKFLILSLEFELIPKQAGEQACKYKADFVYHMADTGKMVVEDVKGCKKGSRRASP